MNNVIMVPLLEFYSALVTNEGVILVYWWWGLGWTLSRFAGFSFFSYLVIVGATNSKDDGGCEPLEERQINKSTRNELTAATELNNKPTTHTRRVLILHVPG